LRILFVTRVKSRGIEKEENWGQISDRMRIIDVQFLMGMGPV
jgi:hypothetical protein